MTVREIKMHCRCGGQSTTRHFGAKWGRVERGRVGFIAALMCCFPPLRRRRLHCFQLAKETNSTSGLSACHYKGYGWFTWTSSTEHVWSSTTFVEHIAQNLICLGFGSVRTIPGQRRSEYCCADTTNNDIPCAMESPGTREICAWWIDHDKSIANGFFF